MVSVNFDSFLYEDGAKEYFYCISINAEDGKGSYYFKNLTDSSGVIESSGNEAFAYTLSHVVARRIYLGGDATFTAGTSVFYFSIDNAIYTSFHCIENLYLDPTSSNDLINIKQFMNFLPHYPTDLLGCSFDGVENENITFDDVESIVDDKKDNYVYYTNYGMDTFSPLNYFKVKGEVVRIMPSPSYLNYQYQNTLLIFTRNEVNRFVFNGNVTDWATETNSVIPELKDRGLLAINSLVSTGSSMLWLSDIGVIRWNAQGMIPISKGIIDIPLEDTAVGMYIPAREQYALCYEDGDAYIYDIYANTWTKFDKFDVSGYCLTTDTSNVENFNLIIRDVGGVNKIYLYPNETTTTSETCSFKTKTIKIRRSKVKRFKLMYGDTAKAAITFTFYNRGFTDGAKLGVKADIHTDISSDTWYSITPGIIPTDVEITISGVDNIESLELDVT